MGFYERVKIDLAYYTAYWPLNRLSYFEEFTLCLYIMDCADIKEKLERIFRLDRWIDRYVPLPFYAVKYLPFFLIQRSSPIIKKGWNFSQFWNPYTP